MRMDVFTVVMSMKGVVDAIVTDAYGCVYCGNDYDGSS